MPNVSQQQLLIPLPHQLANISAECNNHCIRHIRNYNGHAATLPFEPN